MLLNLVPQSLILAIQAPALAAILTTAIQLLPTNLVAKKNPRPKMIPHLDLKAASNHNNNIANPKPKQRHQQMSPLQTQTLLKKLLLTLQPHQMQALSLVET